MITIIIVLVTGLVSFAAFRNRDLMERWLFSPYRAKNENQYYRFITSGLLHADWVHLLINMFEGLLRVDNKTGSYLPGVAEKWEISKDGKKYTFHLRKCKWTNGNDISAEDFVFTFRRAINPKTTSRNASLFFVIKNAWICSKLN